MKDLSSDNNIEPGLRVPGERKAEQQYLGRLRQKQTCQERAEKMEQWRATYNSYTILSIYSPLKICKWISKLEVGL